MFGFSTTVVAIFLVNKALSLPTMTFLPTIIVLQMNHTHITNVQW